MTRRSRSRGRIDRRPAVAATRRASLSEDVEERPRDTEGTSDSIGTGGLDETVRRAAVLVGGWAPTLARVLLGVVLAWFGYHELIKPGIWTGYVPVISSHSNLADALVLAHGWVLFVLAAALIFGIGVRISAGIAAVLLFEIVISLVASGGLSDLVLRDVGVLGLSLSLVGDATQRIALKT